MKNLVVSRVVLPTSNINSYTQEIQLAYSRIPLDNIDILFQVMRKGIETSKVWAEERQRGDSASSFGTALIPTGDKDCQINIS